MEVIVGQIKKTIVGIFKEMFKHQKPSHKKLPEKRFSSYKIVFDKKKKNQHPGIFYILNSK